MVYTKADENEPIIFEKKILRRIFGTKTNEDGDYEIRINRDLDNIYSEPNIYVMEILKSQRISTYGESRADLFLSLQNENQTKHGREEGTANEGRIELKKI